MSISNVRFTGYEAVGPGKGRANECNSPKGNCCVEQNDAGLKSDTVDCLPQQGAKSLQQGSKFNSMA